MKIVWLSHIVPYPPKGGGLQRSYNLIKEISKKHEVHLVSLNQKKILSTSEDLVKAEEVLKKMCKRVDIFPNEPDRSKFHRGIMLLRNFLSSLPYDMNGLYNKVMLHFMEKLSDA